MSPAPAPAIASPSPPGTPPALAITRRPAPGIVAYADAERLVGQLIEIESTHGSRRRGVLVDFNPHALTLRLVDAKERNMQLSMPRRTIARVRWDGDTTAGSPERAEANRP